MILMQNCLILCIGTVFISKAIGLKFTSEGSIDGKSLFECGAKNVRLNCKSDKAPMDVVLRINGYQAVVCSGDCFINKAILGRFERYTVTFNLTAGLIALHIESISKADENNIFQCEAESAPETIHPVIKIFPRNENLTMKITEDKKWHQIKVTTGCTLLMQNPIFTWHKSKTQDGGVKESLSYLEQADIHDDCNCDPLNHCGGMGFSSVLKLPHELEGEDYYLMCTVSTFENTSGNITIVSTRTFTFAEQKREGDNTTVLRSVIFITVCSVCMAIIFDNLFQPVKLIQAQHNLRCFDKDGEVLFVWRASLRSRRTFQLQYKTKAADDWTTVEAKHYKIRANGDIEYSVPGFVPMEDYEARLCSTLYFNLGNLRTVNSCTKTNPFTTRGKPAIPENISLQADSLTHNSLNIQWSCGLDGRFPEDFVVKYRVKGDNDWKEIRKQYEDFGSDTTLTCEVGELLSKTDYEFHVGASNSEGESLTNNPLIIQTKGRPDPPSNVSFERDSLTDNGVTLKWLGGNDGGYRQQFIIRYRQRGVQGWSENIERVEDLGRNVETTFRIEGLSSGTDYEFEVGAENIEGCSWEERFLEVATKHQPKEVSSEENSLTGTSVILKWKYDGEDTQSFVVRYRKQGELNWQDKEVNTTGHGMVESSKITQLLTGTTYEFQVGANNGNRCSWSVDVFVCTTVSLPDPPRNLTFEEESLTDTGVTLRWLAGSNGGSCQAFIVRYRQRGESTFTAIDKKVDDQGRNEERTFRIEHLSSGTDYEIEVGAENIEGTNWIERPLEISTKRKPYNVSAEPVSDASDVRLKWLYDEQDANSFAVRYREVREMRWNMKQVIRLNDGTETTCNITGLLPGRMYEFQVGANNSIDCCWSEERTICTTKSRPTPPTNLSAVSVSISTVELSWNHNGGDIQRFRVRYRKSSVNEWQVVEAPKTRTNYTIKHLAPGTEYEFQVGAENSIDCTWTNGTLRKKTENDGCTIC